MKQKAEELARLLKEHIRPLPTQAQQPICVIHNLYVTVDGKRAGQLLGRLRSLL